MSVRNSKALIGALFIQYCAYGIFYVMDEIKKLAPPVYKEIENLNGEGNGANEENKEADDQSKPQSKLKKFFSQREITDREKDEYRKWEKTRLQKSITAEIVELFPQKMLFHTIIVAICAIRAPTDVAVVLTYFTIILRLLMIFSIYCNKRECLAFSAGAGEAFLNVILFGIAMAYAPN